jgi:drug/metabolite transporter (DMT)-like permease
MILTALMNKKIGYYMYSNIDPKHYGNVAIRVVIGILMLVCIYTSVKYLPLVYVALVSNLAPLITALFSYLFLKKGLGLLDSSVLFISFGGVVILITGQIAQEAAVDPQIQAESSWFVLILPIIALLFQPILMAVASILLRQLRELSELTLSGYMSYSMTLIYGPIVLLTPSQGLTFLDKFYTIDWIIIIILGFVSSSVQICRARAAKYEEPAKLAGINYFQSVIQLVFDVAFFNTVFSMQQVLGIAIVLGAASIRWGIGIKNTFF